MRDVASVHSYLKRAPVDCIDVLPWLFVLIPTSPQDLEAAFRASRRADAFLAIEKKGKAAFIKVGTAITSASLNSSLSIVVEENGRQIRPAFVR